MKENTQWLYSSAVTSFGDKVSDCQVFTNQARFRVSGTILGVDLNCFHNKVEKRQIFVTKWVPAKRWAIEPSNDPDETIFSLYW